LVVIVRNPPLVSPILFHLVEESKQRTGERRALGDRRTDDGCEQLVDGDAVTIATTKRTAAGVAVASAVTAVLDRGREAPADSKRRVRRRSRRRPLFARGLKTPDASIGCRRRSAIRKSTAYTPTAACHHECQGRIPSPATSRKRAHAPVASSAEAEAERERDRHEERYDIDHETAPRTCESRTP
jgi:hypothetical protein